MKLKLLLAFVAISLVACSGDDGNGTTDPVTEKDLKEISGYSSNGTQLDEVIRFENNRMTERDLYYQGEVFYEDRYTYDEEGRLILRTVTNLNEDDSATIELDYDSMGRMTSQVLEYSGYSELTTYNYDQPDQIEATLVVYNGGETTTWSRTYNLNTDGYVSSIESGNHVTLITYEGNNVVSRTEIDNAGLENEQIAGTSVYEYDLDTEVKGAILTKDFIRFGDNKANYELYDGYDYQPARDRYLIATNWNSQDNSSSSALEYDFDDDGFPIQMTEYRQGEEFTRSYITYE